MLAKLEHLNIDGVVSFLLIISRPTLVSNGLKSAWLETVHLRARIWLQAIREGKCSAGEKQEVTGSIEVARRESRTSNVFSSSSLDHSFSFQERNCQFSK